MTPYRALLVLSLDEEETLWQMLDEALETSLEDPQRSYELARFVWEESRHRRSVAIEESALGLLGALWGVAVTVVRRD